MQIMLREMMSEATQRIDIDEPRLFEETGVDARVANLIAPVLKPLGFRLVRVKLSGLNGLTLQIMAERTDGTMTIEDCELVSRTVSPILDVENVVDRKYHLEISSPGIDRSLVRKSDFTTWQGHIAKVETGMIIDGRKKFRGTIGDVDNDGFTLTTDKIAYGEAVSARIPFTDITDAHLVLTDALIQDALKKDKALRQQLIPNDDLELNDGVDNTNNDENLEQK